MRQIDRLIAGALAAGKLADEGGSDSSQIEAATALARFSNIMYQSSTLAS
jgi:hypothetical protein